MSNFSSASSAAEKSNNTQPTLFNFVHLLNKMKSVSRLKIGIGFGLMLATLLGTLFFVNGQMERLTRTAENDTAVWDSLQALLRHKDDNTRRLLRMAGRAGDSLIAAADWERVVEQHDTIIVRQQVRRHVVTRRDTLRTPVQPKKGFFKRLGEAFAPPKEDTTLQVRVTTEVATDTVTYDTFNPVDSLKEALQEAARKQRERNQREALRRQYRWRMDRMLSTRIDSLLKGHEQEALARARAEQERQRKDRLQAARTVGGIATGGIVLAAVFLLLIGRDVTRNNRYRRQTEEAKARAEKLLEERERMMLAITHDFKARAPTLLPKGNERLDGPSAEISDRPLGVSPPGTRSGGGGTGGFLSGKADRRGGQYFPTTD